jgi:DNA polymerase I
MAPRRYERLADAGPATGVLDPLLVRAYLRAGAALPASEAGDGTVHTGAALTSSPRRGRARGEGRRGEPLPLAHAAVPHRPEAAIAWARCSPWSTGWSRASASPPRPRGPRAPPGSPERHTDEALSAAMKLLVNSAYGYLGAVGLTRFADVHAANEVTRRGPRDARPAVSRSSPSAA